MRYYKALDAQGRSCHGGDLQWSLPTWDGEQWVPGEWMPAIEGGVIACERGYHAAHGEGQLLEWLHERVYVIESAAPWEDVVGKVVTRGPVRLVEGTAWDDYHARIFALQCALDVAHQVADDRIYDVLAVVWEHAHGTATDDDLASAWASARASAWASARESARASAWESARESAWASHASRLARFLNGDTAT